MNDWLRSENCVTVAVWPPPVWMMFDKLSSPSWVTPDVWFVPLWLMVEVLSAPSWSTSALSTAAPPVPV